MALDHNQCSALLDHTGCMYVYVCKITKQVTELQQVMNVMFRCFMSLNTLLLCDLTFILYVR